MSGNNIVSINQYTFYNNVNLVWIDLGKNSINYIHPSIFANVSKVRDLNLSGNKVTAVEPETFSANVELQWLNLNDNSITDIHLSIFQTNSKLTGLHISGNKLASIKQCIFNTNRELKWLNLEGNSISEVHPSTFRNNNRLRHLDISRNKITLINPDTFILNRELTFLYIQGNKITEISKSSFRGLEQLEELDLSDNYIEELDPIVFHNNFTSTKRQNRQASKLKHLNLAQNTIQSFNFELYFPMNSNSDSSNPTLQLEFLNLSSNCLTTLNVASMKWLNQTTTATDLTANQRNCDCSVLLEVWRELKHKLTLRCASPSELEGKSWDVMEEFCSQVAEEMNYKYYRSSEAVGSSTVRNNESEVSTQSGGPSVVKITLNVTGVLLVCAVGGGLILAKVVERLRRRPKAPEYWDVHALRATYVSVQSHADVGSGIYYVSVQSYEDVSSESRYATRYSYVAVQWFGILQ